MERIARIVRRGRLGAGFMAEILFTPAAGGKRSETLAKAEHCTHNRHAMQGKVTLEDHFATPATLNDSRLFGPHVWAELGPRLTDFQDKRLRLMDASGVEIMIVSLNAPAVQAIHDVKRAIAVAREANDHLAAEIAKRPDRFRGFAALAMQDPEEAAHEVTRCVKELGFVGALVNGF